MKTLRASVLICTMVLATLSVVAQSSFTNSGDFKVTKSESQMMVEGVEVPTFTIQYENMEAPVQVGIVEEDGCKNYIVRGDGFEIQYVCKKNKFGICYTESKYATMDRREMAKKVNRSEFLHQRVITSSGPKPDKYNVKLIASYLPEVMAVG